MNLKYFLIIFLFFVLVTPCSASTKEAALQMTTCFENEETQLQYNYAENIHDGRGITFGCIGFCTGTGDGNILIKYYTTLNPNNSLAQYIPALNTIDKLPHGGLTEDSNPSLEGLDGFIEAVQTCDDPLFKQAQLHVLDEMYWNPATKLYNKIGGKLPATQALMYDMTVRYGDDYTTKFISRATKSCGGTPASGVDEVTFSKALLAEYGKLLEEEDLGDNKRPKSFETVLINNPNLETPFTFYAYGKPHTITGYLEEVEHGNSTIPGNDTVKVKKPHAQFSYKDQGLKVKFFDKSSRKPASWLWTFGDGKNSTENNPVHVYEKKGKYKVRLTVTNPVGNDTVQKIINVKQGGRH